MRKYIIDLINTIIGIIGVILFLSLIIPEVREIIWNKIYDEIYWKWVCYKDKSENYEAYLEKWPQGRHAKRAREKIDSIHWKEAVDASTIEAFNRYLELHPEGKYAKEAREKIIEGVLAQSLAGLSGHVKKEAEHKIREEMTVGRNVVDLLYEKKIEVKTVGSGIESVIVRMRRLVPYPLKVIIPVGTYFVAARQSSQNMVITKTEFVELETEEWVEVTVPAACANRRRDIPGEDDTFTVQRSPHQKELSRLTPVLEKAEAPFAVQQAAVWIVTDNADFGDLGILVTGFGGFGPRAIDEEAAARAMRICEQASIDIKKKRIWNDRHDILKALPEGDLKRWLQQKMWQ